MKTLCTSDVERAAAVLRSGALVAFPTETVYGLGADALDAAAVASIFAAKGRPADNPLITHVASVVEARLLADVLPEAAETLLHAFAPGPLTVIVPRGPRVPDAVTAGLDTVGLRIPAHPMAQHFLQACARPVAAPSANRSGRPSPTTAAAVLEDMDGRIACVLDGGPTDAGVESTVVDCTTDPPVLLRHGACTVEALRTVCPALRVSSSAEQQARSPGTRYRHYAPQARVVPVAHPGAAAPGAQHAYIGRHAPPAPEAFGLVAVCDTQAAYAHRLFDFFRQADRAGCCVIFAERAPAEGLGPTINDRVARAAAG
ncbi:L-threonylcarbamoyladenylate synthase [Salisaeta longa]|uniref:L-threonylcarbamoyladenylate synthase n=1 Tax=Salisaeta longa TaxID=503170 RepID=UPI0003B66F81|nr:L-threonylcarbamoyladenylate synthase [Salisaeta longa]